MIIHPAGVFDNQARAYEHIVVEELAAAMGAEVKGVVDLAAVTDEQFAEIEHVLFRHKRISSATSGSVTPTMSPASASATSPTTPTPRGWRATSTSSR